MGESRFYELVHEALKKVQVGQVSEAQSVLQQAIAIRDSMFPEPVIQPRSDRWELWNQMQKAIDGVRSAIHQAENA